MASKALKLLLAFCLVCGSLGLNINSLVDSTMDNEGDIDELMGDERQILFNNALGLNLTQIIALSAIALSTLLTLLGLTALGFLLFSLLLDDKDDYGYGHDPYGHGSSYGAYRSFDPYAIDWEKFSILDWIAAGEDAWRTFDPSDVECQKRFVCEIHQNTSRFGSAAKKMVDIFSYLQYATVLRLPDEVKALVEDFLDAADRGRSMAKDCGESYSACEFSVKKMVERITHSNEI